MRRRFMNHSVSWDYNNYLTIEAIEDVSALFNVEVQWTTNGLKWETSKRVVAKAGQLVSIKRNTMQEEKFSVYWNDGAYNLRGNVMSLLFGDDAKGKTSMLGYSFNSVFSNSNVITIEKGFLPATTLAYRCYFGMFAGCRSLVTAPELPATTLAYDCYNSMFQDCTSLVTAPELPATTLADSCYQSMFEGCTSLTKAPELPATYLKYYCYLHMFYGCSNLNYITMLATDISASSCLNSWVSDVASSGTFVKNAAMTTLPSGNHGIPTGWTVVDNLNQPYTVDLNNQWELSSTVSNPNSVLYEGVYQSFSNKGIDSKAAVMYIDINDCTDLDLYIRSHAESSYDYVMVSQLDQTIDNNTSYSNSALVKAHTRGNQKSGNTISDYTKVSFTGIDGGKHRITIVYRKDWSSHSGDDRGYVLIVKK